LDDLPEEVRNAIKFIPADNIDDVLRAALVKKTRPKKEKPPVSDQRR
jgi:ATP-dependent Lon protease